ncbi:hypothetical protein [Sphingobacterium sp. UBA5670]|uniref:hypothetical protein n=1 Tax=Sphingobacterium sp. UBA5670 TaxID=1947502 RepID=UPI0025D160CF|nr:hypothetical protein [Sphingobacterium sp. UBA5670]
MSSKKENVKTNFVNGSITARGAVIEPFFLLQILNLQIKSVVPVRQLFDFCSLKVFAKTIYGKKSYDYRVELVNLYFLQDLIQHQFKGTKIRINDS